MIPSFVKISHFGPVCDRFDLYVFGFSLKFTDTYWSVWRSRNLLNLCFFFNGYNLIWNLRLAITCPLTQPSKKPSEAHCYWLSKLNLEQSSKLWLSMCNWCVWVGRARSNERKIKIDRWIYIYTCWSFKLFYLGCNTFLSTRGISRWLMGVSEGWFWAELQMLVWQPEGCPKRGRKWR